jgi:hypothetical protein
MNRRSFIGGFAASLAGFTILPAATTYGRCWKAVRTGQLFAVPNPKYERAIYELAWIPVEDGGIIERLPIWPVRFNAIPTNESWNDPVKYRKWAIENSIPPYILKKP